MQVFEIDDSLKKLLGAEDEYKNHANQNSTPDLQVKDKDLLLIA